MIRKECHINRSFKLNSVFLTVIGSVKVGIAMLTDRWNSFDSRIVDFDLQKLQAVIPDWEDTDFTK